MRSIGEVYTVRGPIRQGDCTEDSTPDCIDKFHELHEQHYTFRLDDTETEIVNLHVTAFGTVEKPHFKKRKTNTTIEDAKIEVRDVYFENPRGWISTEVYQRDLLPANEKIHGPAIIEEKSAVTVLYKGQTLTVDDYGNLI